MMRTDHTDSSHMNMAKKIKVAIVGFGLSGATLHAPSILKIRDFDLVAVVSSNREKVAVQLPHAQIFDTVDEMLCRVDVDLIVIATPNHTHYALTKACLQKGKHVVVEKPIVLNLVQA